MCVEGREQAVHHASAIVVRQVESARAEGTARRTRQTLDRLIVEGGGVDQILVQHTRDAPVGRIHLRDPPALRTRSANDRRSGGIDDRGHAARVCIQQLVVIHRTPLLAGLGKHIPGIEMKAARPATPQGAQPHRCCRTLRASRHVRTSAYLSASNARVVISSTAPSPEILRTLGALASPDAAHLL